MRTPKQEPRKCKIQNPKVTKNHTKVSTILGDGTSIQVGWHAPHKTHTGLTMNHLNHPMPFGNYKVSKPSIQKGINAAYHCAAPKTPFNTSAKALRFLLQLLDGPFLRRTASGLPRHCGGTVRGSYVFIKGCCLHHVNLFPFCTGRLLT